MLRLQERIAGSLQFTQTVCYSYIIVYFNKKFEFDRVGETSEATPHPETLGAVSQLLTQQQAAVSQLDAQRPNIVSMLQRGRDLTKDPHAPQFVNENVAILEEAWNAAYQSTLDKLNKLKSLS